jgi:hypothetical protein
MTRITALIFCCCFAATGYATLPGFPDKNDTSSYRFATEQRSLDLSLSNSIWDEDTVFNIDYGFMDPGYYRNEQKHGRFFTNRAKSGGSAERERRFQFQSGFLGAHLIHENLINSITEFLDTSKYSLSLSALLSSGQTRYAPAKETRPKFFCSIDADVFLEAGYGRLQDYLPQVDLHLPDSFKTDRVIVRQCAGRLGVRAAPGIGAGKKIPATPYYHALHLEKMLLRDSVINFPLSVKTRQALTALFARNYSYRLREYANLKTFKAELDSLVSKDEAADTGRMRYLAPLAVKKVILCNAPQLFAGPRVTLSGVNLFEDGLSYTKREYPFATEHDAFRDSSFIRNYFTYSLHLKLDFDWGTAINRFLFLEIRAHRPLFSASRSFHLYGYPGHNPDLDEALDIRWDMQASFWFTHWMVIIPGIAGLPAWLAVPRNRPYSIFLNTVCFIEDYLGIGIKISHNSAQDPEITELLYSTPFERITRGFFLNLALQYYF